MKEFFIKIYNYIFPPEIVEGINNELLEHNKWYHIYKIDGINYICINGKKYRVILNTKKLNLDSDIDAVKVLRVDKQAYAYNTLSVSTKLDVMEEK